MYYKIELVFPSFSIVEFVSMNFKLGRARLTLIITQYKT